MQSTTGWRRLIGENNDEFVLKIVSTARIGDHKDKNEKIQVKGKLRGFWEKVTSILLKKQTSKEVFRKIYNFLSLKS